MVPKKSENQDTHVCRSRKLWVSYLLLPQFAQVFLKVQHPETALFS